MSGVSLTHNTIDVAALLTAAQRDTAGAVSLFLGAVRAETDATGRALSALDYSAYEEMALDIMTAQRAAALERFDILEAICVHRLGRVALGEPSVAIVVAAAHRPAAFEACRWLIDALKKDAPIWKQDVWSDGAVSWSSPNVAHDESADHSH